jgi:hypothetical protein
MSLLYAVGSKSRREFALLLSCKATGKAASGSKPFEGGRKAKEGIVLAGLFRPARMSVGIP